MKYIDHSIRQYTRILIYAVLAIVSSSLGFLGYRDVSGFTVESGDSLHIFQKAHADAPRPPGPPGGGGDGDGDTGGGADGGAGGNGSDDGSDGGGDGGDGGE